MVLSLAHGDFQEESLLERWEREVSSVVQKVRPSVVSIRARFTARADRDVELRRTLQFSGIIYRKDGYVVTDAGALEGAEGLEVTTWDGRTLEGKLVAQDGKTGIALLRVSATDLTAVETVGGKDLPAGSLVVSVGNSFGLAGSASVGTLGGSDRSIRVGGRRFDRMIQLAIPANPGDCGGLVADARGRLVGILHSVYSDESESEWFPFLGRNSAPRTSLVFATPMETVRFVTDRMIRHGRMVRGWLGVSVRAVEGGAEVLRVEVGSPARRAGFRKGDVLLAWDGEAIGDVDAWQRKIEGFEEPRTVRLTVRREGAQRDCDVRIELEPGRK